VTSLAVRDVTRVRVIICHLGDSTINMGADWEGLGLQGHSTAGSVIGDGQRRFCPEMMWLCFNSSCYLGNLCLMLFTIGNFIKSLVRSEEYGIGFLQL
jgi:hypothetical protein